MPHDINFRDVVITIPAKRYVGPAPWTFSPIRQKLVAIEEHGAVQYIGAWHSVSADRPEQDNPFGVYPQAPAKSPCGDSSCDTSTDGSGSDYDSDTAGPSKPTTDQRRRQAQSAAKRKSQSLEDMAAYYHKFLVDNCGYTQGEATAEIEDAVGQKKRRHSAVGAATRSGSKRSSKRSRSAATASSPAGADQGQQGSEAIQKGIPDGGEEEIDLEPFLSKKASAGYLGVSWISNRQKYQSRIYVNSVKKLLGYFDTVAEAAQAYARAYTRVHGGPPGPPAPSLADQYLEPFLSKKSKSGYLGVSWNSNSQKYLATIGVNGVKKHLGLFDTAEEAAQAYARAYVSK